MKKLVLVAMVVAMGVLLTVPAFAFGSREGRGEGYCGKYLSWKLNLTDEQKTKIESLQTANLKEVRPMREKMFDKSVELRRLWLQANPDKTKINAAQKEMRTLRDGIEDKDTALKLEIRKLLTLEQNEKLANSHWGRGSGFGPRGGVRGNGEFGQDRSPGPGMGMRQ